MKIAHYLWRKSLLGFTLIELMIVVAIIAILAAVSFPIYTSYIRRSYVSEATTSISSIKSAEESFFTINNCYVSATAHPAAIPAGVPTAWDTGLPAVWGTGGLGVRPDRQVRFQYEVIASNDISAAMGCAAPAVTWANLTAQGCVTQATIKNTITNPAIFPTNWYFVVARGDLDGDSGGAANAATSSWILSGIDDSTVFMCNETF